MIKIVENKAEKMSARDLILSLYGLSLKRQFTTELLNRAENRLILLDLNAKDVTSLALSLTNFSSEFRKFVPILLKYVSKLTKNDFHTISSLTYAFALFDVESEELLERIILWLPSIISKEVGSQIFLYFSRFRKKVPDRIFSKFHQIYTQISRDTTESNLQRIAFLLLSEHFDGLVSEFLPEKEFGFSFDLGLEKERLLFEVNGDTHYNCRNELQLLDVFRKKTCSIERLESY